MLIPQTRFIGALAILLSFIFIATQIRLGFLCEMVIVCCLLFVPNGNITGLASPSSSPLDTGLAAFFLGYLALLPIARAGMYYNQLAHKRLPRSLQAALDAYAN